MSASPEDRRPIASRELSVVKRTSSALVRAGVSADAISVASMVAGGAAGAALALTSCLPAWQVELFVAAPVLILARLIANMLDGMVAIESGKASALGELYNEVPDRVSDSAILIGAGYAVGGWVVMGYGAALAAMFTAYVRAVGKGAGARQDFSGPMAKQQRMFTIIAVSLWTAFTPESWPAVMGWALALIAALSLFTTGRRVVRIAAQLKRVA